MADAGAGRKLASIVAIDVAGYSRRSETDEAAAIRAVAGLRERVIKAAAAHGGRLFNTAGDGFMLEFPTASGALAAAEEIAAAGDPPVRVGVHLGEVSLTGSGDLLGHGVNVAARIQQMASPGAVLASGDVKRAIRGPLGERLRPQGSVRLDKMSETLPVFALAPAEGGRAKGRRRDLKRPVAAAGILAALILAGLCAWLAGGMRLGAPRPTRIAVLPFETLSPEPAARYFAEGLSDQVLGVLTTRQVPTVSGDDARALRGAERDQVLGRLGVAMLLDGSVQSDGANLVGALHLEDAPRHVTLWSTRFQGPSAQAVELQAQVAAQVAAILNCAARALRPAGGLSDPAPLSLYLHACQLFQERSEDGNPQTVFELLSTLRQVIAQAPNFAAAHSDLAKYEAYYATGYFGPDLLGGQEPQLLKEAASHARRALQLDAKDADAYVALSMLVPAPGWSERERLLRQGLAADPEWPHANGFLFMVLAETGRMKEAAGYVQRAAAANPETPGLGWSPSNAAMLAVIGAVAPADDMISGLRKLWPHDPDVWEAEYRVALYDGRWDQALRTLGDPAALTTGLQPRDIEVGRSVLLAARSRTPAAIGAARRALLAYVGTRPSALPIAIADLSMLGLVDDAFGLADGYPRLSRNNGNYVALFVPPTAAMRRDRRFMALAAKLGLVDHWRTSGKWPDFCSEPGLPYDCKAEAAKIPAGSAK